MGRLSGAVCIFDLDGTLVDSAPDLSASLNIMLERAGLAPMPPEETRSQVGHGARALMAFAYRRQDRVFPDGAEADGLVDAFVEVYAARIADLSRPFPGVVDSLKRLSAEGAALTVCTNKKEVLARPLLQELDLLKYFSMVIGSDTLEERKPSPFPLRHILRETSSDRGIMIGDTTTDRNAAEAAGLPSLIATFGYGRDGEDLASAAWFDCFEDLPDLILQTIG
ncbi:MAG: HAD-IA family hydrolase [Pseudomonadota bacterium]